MSLRILVTGGAGFLGGHLCRLLLSQGHHVTCLDNFATGREENVKSFASHANFALLRQDVQFPVQSDFERIYNLACPASPVHYQADPVNTMKTSIFGALNVLELATRTGARVLQASTSEVYGDPLVHPQPESYWGNVNPVGVRSCYDEGKRAAETLFFDYHRKYGTKIKVVRIFNTYGPGMRADDGRVVSNLVTQALRGDQLTIFGDGTQTRSFCYVSDLVDVINRMMESDESFVGPVNIGNPNEFSMNELARKVVDLTKSKSAVKFVPLPLDDPRLRCPDISLARHRLGWSPTVPLDEGLVATIEYFSSSERLSVS